MSTDCHNHIVELFFQLTKCILVHINTQIDMDVGIVHETLNFLVPDGFGQPLPGNYLAQFAAELSILLKDMGFNTFHGQLPGGVHAAGTTTDDSDFLTDGFSRFRRVNLTNGTS